MSGFVATYKCVRGQTFIVGLRVKSGEVAGSEIIRCAAKRLINGALPGDDAEDDAVFAIAFHEASGAEMAFWSLSLTPDQTESMATGSYGVDARIELNGVVQQTLPFKLEVVERVTEPA